MKTFKLINLIIITLMGHLVFGQEARLKDINSAVEVLKKKPVTTADLTSRTERYLLDSTICFFVFGEAWENDTKTLFEYNEAGQLIRDSSMTWYGEPPVGMGWFTEHKQSYTHLASGLLHETVSLQWSFENEAWSLDTFKSTNVYDGDRLIKVINATYDSELQFWDESIIDSLIYDDQFVLLGRVAGFYFGGEFVPVAIVEYEYEGDNIIAETFEFSFDGGETWIPFFREIYDYNDGVLISQITQFFEQESETFENAALQLFDYDDRDLLVQSHNYFWLDEWIQGGICEYYYSREGSTGISNPIAEDLQVLMSNPFNGGRVVIQTEAIRDSANALIMNLQGNIIFQGPVSGNFIDIPKLNTPGMYLLIIQGDQQTLAVKRFIATAH